MRRSLALISLMIPFLLAAYASPANPMLGQWDCKSVDERGTAVLWTLTVNEEKGKLSGWIQIGEDRVDLVNPKLDGSTFTFSAVINPEETVDISLKVDGNKLEGKFSGKASGTGSVTGQKKPA